MRSRIPQVLGSHLSIKQCRAELTCFYRKTHCCSFWRKKKDEEGGVFPLSQPDYGVSADSRTWLSRMEGVGAEAGPSWVMGLGGGSAGLCPARPVDRGGHR